MWKSTSVILRATLCSAKTPYSESLASFRNVPLQPPKTYDDVEFPERTKLKFIEKVPQYPPSLRPPKMMKMLRLMRGPEEVHNFLVHKQYGVMATCGGRMKWNHFEMIRLAVVRKLDYDKAFAVWRVDSPWQAVTKKGQGQRMGGGKGAIDHYVTPVKAGRIIFEIGGKLEFFEVKPLLEMIIGRLPFRAIAVSEEILQEMKEKERILEETNINPYTFKYIVQNNMGGCHKWISPYDKKWFGKHV